MLKVRIGLALSAVAVAAVLAGCSDKTAGSTQTLNFTELDKGTHFALIGNATGQKVPPGSGFSLSVPLQDSSNNTVGEINAVCIATKPSKRLFGTCSGTAQVPDGQLAINVGGAVVGNASGAVVGGTGKYTGATGTFTSKSSNGGSTDTFTFTLP